MCIRDSFLSHQTPPTPPAAGPFNAVVVSSTYGSQYTDNVLGPIKCTGVHVMTVADPNGRDTFTCTSTTGSPLLGVKAGQTMPLSIWQQPGKPAPTWTSDYSARAAKTWHATVSSDGMSYTAQATY